MPYRENTDTCKNEKKPPTPPTHITGDIQGLPDKKIPSTIDLSKMTPEAEKYLKIIILTNRHLNSKTTKLIEPLSQKQTDLFNTEVDGHVATLFVDKSTKEVSEIHGHNDFTNNSISELENQHGTLEAPNISSNISAQTNTITKSQDPVEVSHSDRGSSRVIQYENQTCDECGAILSSIHTLKNHQLTKHDSKGYTYQCDQCKYQSAHKAGLERQIITHHDNIIYPCNLCDYKATQRGSLKIHRESKHEGAQFPCEFCGKVFSLKQTQRNHTEYTHGQKRHKCDSCEYIAGQKTHLNTHKKLKHSNVLKTE